MLFLTVLSINNLAIIRGYEAKDRGECEWARRLHNNSFVLISLCLVSVATEYPSSLIDIKGCEDFTGPKCHIPCILGLKLAKIHRINEIEVNCEIS